MRSGFLLRALPDKAGGARLRLRLQIRQLLPRRFRRQSGEGLHALGRAREQQGVGAAEAAWG